MSRLKYFARVALVLVSVVMSVGVVHAQFRASIRGTITDPQGAVVPGATVTLVNKQTNRTVTATSDANGIYQFNALEPVPYRLTVEAPGFQKKVLQEVRIIPEQLNSLNLQLEVGQVQQEVTVSGTTQALDTETATVSGTISSNQIQHMPSFNRDVFQLAQLAPGVFGDASQGSGGGTYNLPGNQGPGGSGTGAAGIFQTENGPQVQNAGGQYETNSISIDGISTVSAVWGGTSVITPSEDSVQDMKVVSNNYDAEYGRFSGAQIQVVSKSGSNDFHGSAFFKASRPGLNAYQRWNGVGSNKPGTPAQRGLNRDNSRFNNYGGSLGGPIWKNKIFAFFNIETSPLVQSATSQGWYETSQFDSSSASSGSIAAKYLSFPGSGANGSAIVSRDCTSIGLTPGVNCAEITSPSGAPLGLDIGSPITAGLGQQDLTYGGSSGTPGVGAGLDGLPDIAFFNTVNPNRVSQTQYNGRVDADVTEKDRLTFAMYWQPVTTTSYNGPVRRQNLWHKTTTNNAFSAMWNRTFSPTLLNQARVNAAGWRWNEAADNPQEPFGLPQANIDNIGSANINYFGAPGPSHFDQWTYTFNDVLTKVAGRHSLKTGFEFTRLFFLNDAIYAARPNFTFHNLWDFANDAPYNESGEFNPKSGIPFSNREDNRENLLGIFVQDDFKIRPNLTVNLGLRWSYFGTMYAKQNNLDVLQLGSGANALTNLRIRVGGHLATPQKSNFGPVIGFAWSPNQSEGKLVFRGGFGIAYNQNEIAITASGYGNPPNAVSPFFHCDYPYTSNPSCTGTGILYSTATDLHSLFGYPSNPAAITNAFTPENLPTSGNLFLNGFSSSPKTIANYHYSLDMQYQFPQNLVFTLGYQGNETRHLLIHSNWNAIGAAAGLALNHLVTTVNYWDNTGNANYNGLIATLTHNFSRGFQASAQYTWARAMDENSGPYYEDPYPYSTSAAYGRANYDVRNAFKLFGLWQPTLFRGNRGWLEKIAGGWSLSGIWNLHSGFPWDPFYSANGPGLYYGGSGYGTLRPAGILAGAGTGTANSNFMQSTNPNYHGNGTQFLVPPTFVSGATFPSYSPAPAPGMHRNSLNGPAYNDVDVSLAKAFGLPRIPGMGEAAKFEIRADVYNFFNKININTSSIDAFLGSVNPDGSLNGSPNAHFGVANNALGSRTVQLQARFSF